MIKNVILEKRFITSPLYQLLSPFLSFLFFCFLFGTIFYKSLILLSFFFLIIFIFTNLEYIMFNFKEENLTFSIKLIFLLLIDMLIVFFALVWGTLIYFKGEKY